MYQAVGHVPRLLLAGGTCRHVSVTNESLSKWRHVHGSEGRSNRHCDDQARAVNYRMRPDAVDRDKPSHSYLRL